MRNIEILRDVIKDTGIRKSDVFILSKVEKLDDFNNASDEMKYAIINLVLTNGEYEEIGWKGMREFRYIPKELMKATETSSRIWDLIKSIRINGDVYSRCIFDALILRMENAMKKAGQSRYKYRNNKEIAKIIKDEIDTCVKDVNYIYGISTDMSQRMKRL